MDPQALRALEQAQQRILTLVTTLDRLRAALQSSDTLPDWPSLSKQSAIIAQNIAALAMTLSSTSSILDRTVVYPRTTFPGEAQAGVLEQLLNAKPSAEAGEWLGSQEKDDEKKPKLARNLSSEESRELWSWAGPAVAEEARRQFAGDGEDDDFSFGDDDGS